MSNYRKVTKIVENVCIIKCNVLFLGFKGEDYEQGEDDQILPSDVKHITFNYTRPTEEDILKRSSKFYKIASMRRSLRFFDPDPIPKEVIHNIIKAAGN